MTARYSLSPELLPTIKSSLFLSSHPANKRVITASGPGKHCDAVHQRAALDIACLLAEVGMQSF